MAEGTGLAELRLQAGVYRHLLGARLRSDWQYRTSFVLLVVAQAIVAGLDLALIAVLFGRVDALAGWSAIEVALLYGLGGVAFRVADLFASQVEYAARHIRAGTFDRFLLRPVGPLLQLSANEFALRRAGRLVQPVVVLVIALAGAAVDSTPARAVLVPVAVASGTAIFGAVWVITSSVAFWTVETQELANAFTYGGNHLTQYPLDLVDVERLCRRLLIIDHGRVIEDSTVAAIKDRHGRERVLVVDLEEPRPPLDVPGTHVVRTEGARQWLRFQRDDHTAAAVLAQVVARAPVRDLAIEDPPIEEIVRRIYAGREP